MSGGPLAHPRAAGLPRYSTAAAGMPENAVYLASNESPFGPLPSVLAALSAESHRVNRYPDMHATALRARLGERWGVESDRIVVGTGSVGILQQIIGAFAGPGDEVIYPWRSFEAYPLLIAAGGATGVAVPLTPDAHMDLPALSAAIGPRTRVVLLCSPNNPTGTAAEPGAIDAFITAAPSDVLVVVDEAYAEFVAPEMRLDTGELVHKRPNVCVVRTFSKGYGLAGVRIGYAVASTDVADALRGVFLPFGVSALAAAAALASLSAENELAERVAYTVARRDAVAEHLRERGWLVPVTHANFVWLACREDAESVGARLRAGGVIGRVFAGEGVRLTIGTDRMNDRMLMLLAEGPRA